MHVYAQMLESIVVDLPRIGQDLCLDKGYDNPTSPVAVAEAGYQLHIQRIGEDKLDPSGEKPTRPGGGW